jgi:hypothetical protein
MRSIRGVSDEDARKRLLPMNCLSWNVGHLAWQEQRYFLYFAQGEMPLPQVNRDYAYGAPACTPALADVLDAWKTITDAADIWLDSLTTSNLMGPVLKQGQPTSYFFGNLLQRVIYHYWYHTGENMAIRQMLGHQKLPEFVGNIDGKAPYRPDAGD